MRSQLAVVVAVLVAILVALPACLDVEPPTDAQFTCIDDEICPGILVCDTVSRRCVQPGSGDGLALDDVAIDRPFVGRTFAAGDGTIAVTLTFSAALAQSPRVQLLGPTQRIDLDDVVAATTVDGDGDRTFVATFAPTGDEEEGRYTFIVDAIDAGGVARTVIAPAADDAIVVDYTPPRAVAVSVQRLPDPTKTAVARQLQDTTAIGPAIDVRVVFAADEDIVLDGVDAPTLSGDGSVPLAFVRDASSQRPLVFDLDWSAGASDGPQTLTAHLCDLAGNVSDTALTVVDSAGSVVDVVATVDTARPAPPRVDVEGVLVFERGPWGRLDAARRDVYRLSASANAVDADNFVIVTRDERGDAELARVRANDDGAFVASGNNGTLPTGDIDTVYVTAFDDAGNASDTAAVRDIRWYVTPVDKVVGDIVRNPHSFQVVPRLMTWREPGGIGERGSSDFGGGDDDVDIGTTGAGSWRQVPNSESVVLGDRAFDATFASDPVRGFSMLLGGGVVRLQQQPFPHAQCTTYEGRAFVRDVDDRWSAVSGAPSSRAALVWVPPLEQIVAVGSNGALTAFDGTTFTELCSGIFGGNACDVAAGTDPEQFNRALVGDVVWDAAREVVVGSLGGAAFEIAFPPTGRPVLRQTDTPLSGDAGLAFHDRLGVVVVYDGNALFALDDDGLTPLCGDGCTAPPAHPGGRLAYDRRHDALLLFGGGVDCDGLTPLIATNPDATPPPRAPTDLWSFDGTRWTDVTPALSPSPRGREAHAFGWDDRRQRVVLVGGDDCRCADDPPGSVFGLPVPPLSFVGGVDGDTWEWDGTSWHQLVVRTAPAGFTRAAMSDARDHVAVSAPAQGGVVAVVDGGVRLFRDDTWFSGGAAVTRPLSPAWTTTSTGELMGIGGGEIAFDGFGTPFLVALGPPQAATTIENGAASAAPQCEFFVDDACGPPFNARFGAVAFHDGERLHVFGGSDGVGLGETAFNHATDQHLSYSPAEGWREPCAGTSCGTRPSPRVLHRGVVDGDGDLVVFGGIVDGGVSDETWRFDGTSWTPLTSTTRPPARYGHAMAYDVARDAVVVAYGAASPGGAVFSGNGTTGPPVAGQRAIPADRSAVWELVDDVWFEAPIADIDGGGAPVARSSVAGAGLLEGGMLIVGGTASPATALGDFDNNNTPSLDDTWIWDGGADTRPAHRVRVTTSAAIAHFAVADTTSIELRWRGHGTRLGTDVEVPLELLWWNGRFWDHVDDVIDCGAGCIGGRLSPTQTKLALASPSHEPLLAVAPVENNGAAARVVVVSDFVEVALAYRRP